MKKNVIAVFLTFIILIITTNSTIVKADTSMDEIKKSDVNRDGIVNQTDLDLITSNINGQDMKYDLNGDGVVDIYDTVIVSRNVGKKITKVIVVDPGHNFGGDDGAYSPDKRYIERELNMQVAVKLQARLINMGYTVIMTRQPWERPVDDLKTSLKQRSDIANNAKADFFVSLHHNSGGSNSSGISIYYSTYKPGVKNVQADLIPLTSGYDGYTDTKPSNQGIVSRNFAKNVEEALTSRCGYPKDGYDAGRIGYIDRNLSVTVNTNMPSVLIELGYISNYKEAARCSDQNEQQNKANVIADEIGKMF